jgi:hypothetical protein
MNRRDTLRALLALAAGTSADVRAADGGAPRRLVSLSSNSGGKRAEESGRRRTLGANGRAIEVAWLASWSQPAARQILFRGHFRAAPFASGRSDAASQSNVICGDTRPRQRLPRARATHFIPDRPRRRLRISRSNGGLDPVLRPTRRATSREASPSSKASSCSRSSRSSFARSFPTRRRLAWIACPGDLVKVGGGEFRPEPTTRG